MKQSFGTVQIMELVMKRVWKQTLNVNIIYKNVQGNVFRFVFTLNISLKHQFITIESLEKKYPPVIFQWTCAIRPQRRLGRSTLPCSIMANAG